MQWMAKIKQALSKETNILEINGRNMYVFKTFTKYKSLVATSSPNKMGLALYCHGEHKYTKWRWKKEEIQRGRRVCSCQALADLQASLIVYFKHQNVQDGFRSSKLEEIG